MTLTFPTRRVVLGTDQATASGWCIHVGHTPVRYGLARDALARQAVVRLASVFAGELGGSATDFVFVFENHAGIRRHWHASLSLAGSLHRWFEHLDLLGHPAYLRIGVAPVTWQATVLGVCTRETSEERKAQSLRWASDHVRAQISSHDVADAIGLSRWGTTDGLRELDRRKWEGSVKKRIQAAARRKGRA